MIVLGVLLIIIGVIAAPVLHIAGLGILVTLGIILFVIGVILAIFGHLGHPVGHRAHWY